MSMGFTILIQDAVSDVVEQARVETSADVLAHLNGYDWAGERAREAALGEAYCSPQLAVANESSGNVLHIIPEEDGNYEIWFHTDGPARKLLGLIPLPRASALYTSSKATKDTVQAAIDHFLKDNKHWFEKTFQKD